MSSFDGSINKDKDADTVHSAVDELNYEKPESSPRQPAIMRAITIQEDEPARELRLRRQVSQVDTSSRIVGEFR